MSTEQNLHDAFAGEAKAAVRLTVFARKAQEEEYEGIAKLFRSISASESVHAGNNLRLLKEIKDTETNLRESLGSEEKIAAVGYTKFVAEAEEEGKDAAATMFTYARDVEDRHAKLYDQALQHLVTDEVPDYFVCSVCGYVADTFKPDNCPICGAPAEQFFDVT